MATLLIDDKLWTLLEPLFPKRIRGTKGGQPPKSDRVCLSGILFVLKTGIPWEDFPQEMGCSGMTLHNRLRQWKAIASSTKSIACCWRKCVTRA